MNKSKRILICEDDEGVAGVVKIILEENGYQAKILYSAKQIARKVKEYWPDLILMDILMPGVSGKEAIKILKRDGLTRNIPIVIISALNNLEKLAQDLGAQDFIYKPFKIESLLKTVEKYA